MLARPGAARPASAPARNPGPGVGRMRTLTIAWLALAAGAEAQSARLPLDAEDATWHGAAEAKDGVKGGAAAYDVKGAHIDAGACPVASNASFTLAFHVRTTNA